MRNCFNFQNQFDFSQHVKVMHSNAYYVIVNKLTLQILTVIQRSGFSVAVL